MSEKDLALLSDPAVGSLDLASSDGLLSIGGKVEPSEAIASSIDSEDDSVALRSANGFEPIMPVTASPSPLQAYAVAGESPAHDLENLARLLPSECEAKAASKVERVRHVLVLGATGKLGRMVLHRLSSYERLTINCLVRANKPEVATTRLRDALESVCSDLEAGEILSRVRVWTGDVSLEKFGMSETDYSKLTQRVEGVFVLVGADTHAHLQQSTSEVESLYASMAGNSVHFWRHVLSFASTYRHKHIWTPTPIYYTAQLLTPCQSGQSTRVAETISPSTPGAVSPHQTYVGYQAWRKIVVEQLLALAQTERKMSITIFRLPPTSFHTTLPLPLAETMKTKCAPLSWHLIRLVVRTGLMPDLPHHFYTLFFHPIDQAVQNMVTLSLCRKRLHSTYNVLEDQNANSNSRQSFIDVLGELGIFVKVVPTSEFAAKAFDLTDLDPISLALCQDVQDLGKQLNGYDKASIISNVNFEQDRQLNMEAFEERAISVNPDFVRDGLCGLLRLDYFPSNSLGTFCTFEDCVQKAIESSSGLQDFGEWFELIESGWRLLLEELHSQGSRFSAKAICARNLVVHLTALLFMHDRERRCPEITKLEIVNPVFIVGLNRAGTTLLHQMLSQDHTRIRCPTQMELAFPYGPNGDYQPVGLQANDPSAWQEDPRKEPAMALAQLNGDQSLPVSAAEDSTPFDMLARSFALTSTFGLPKYRAWLLADGCNEMRKCYALHKRLMQHLEYQRPGKRWMFRWPWHLFTIDSLLATYPDAEIIFVHRRPASAVQAYCMHEYELQRMYLERAESDVVGSASLSALSQAVGNAVRVQEEMALAFVQQHPALQPPQSFFLNIYLDEFVSNPTGTIANIYNALGMPPLTVSAEKAMWNFLQETTKLQDVIAAKSNETFGLTREHIRSHFSTYSQLYFNPDQRRKRKQEYKVAKAIRTNAVEPRALYDERGTIIMDGKSWIDRVGLSSPVNNMEVLLSYARTRFASANSADE